jgi:integrase
VFVRQRANRWLGRVAIKGYPEQVKSFRSEAEAYAWGAQVEQQIQAGGYAAPDRTTLVGALKRYESEVTVLKKGAAKEASVIRQLSAHPAAALPLAKVRGADIAGYRDAMKADGYAPATIARHLAVLSNVFNTARREWAIEVANPVELVKKPVIRNARSTRVTTQELEKIVGASQSHELRGIVLLAVETCMRRSELAALRWERVDLTKRVITLTDSKNGEGRGVPLSSRAVGILESLPRRIDGRVFGMSPDSITQAFERASARAGLSGIRIHDLRHEAVSRLFEQGLDMMEVASISGHKTLQMLKRYTHLKAEDLARKLA